MVKFSAADELLGFVYQIVCTAATLKWSRAMQAVTILRNGFKVVMLFVCYGKPKKDQRVLVLVSLKTEEKVE